MTRPFLSGDSISPLYCMVIFDWALALELVAHVGGAGSLGAFTSAQEGQDVRLAPVQRKRHPPQVPRLLWPSDGARWP